MSSVIGLITACITSVLFLNNMFISEYYIIAYILKHLILKQCAFYLHIMSKKRRGEDSLFFLLYTLINGLIYRCPT